MAETPFTPESGASSGGLAPEDGSQGSSAQPPADVSPSPLGVPAEQTEQTPPVEAVSVDPPAPSEPVSAPEPPAAVVEPPVAVSSSDAAPQETSAAEPADTEAPAAGEPGIQPPGVAATITVPPLEEAGGSGGEWELLVERFNTWWSSGELSRQWQRIRGPLKGVAILVAVVLALQVYATVVRTVDGIPLVSGLLELTGLIAVLRFSATRLLRSGDRQEVLAQLRRRWLDFRGRE